MAFKESLSRRVLAWGAGLVVFAITATASVAFVSTKVEAEIRAIWGEAIICDVTPEGKEYYDGDLTQQEVEVRCPQFTTKVPMSPEDGNSPQTTVWVRGDSIFIAGDWSHGGNRKPPVKTHWWEILLMAFFPLTIALSLLTGRLVGGWLRKRSAVRA
ncbi:MAG TPA: hypothetical protein VFT87_04505 [Candidatus Saccharimonadales bacterium]|nr:hypothetical protein [Candidatus Saccharimonadales bacterium]